MAQPQVLLALLADCWPAGSAQPATWPPRAASPRQPASNRSGMGCKGALPGQCNFRPRHSYHIDALHSASLAASVRYTGKVLVANKPGGKVSWGQEGSSVSTADANGHNGRNLSDEAGLGKAGGSRPRCCSWRCARRKYSVWSASQLSGYTNSAPRKTLSLLVYCIALLAAWNAWCLVLQSQTLSSTQPRIASGNAQGHRRVSSKPPQLAVMRQQPADAIQGLHVQPRCRPS